MPHQQGLQTQYTVNKDDMQPNMLVCCVMHAQIKVELPSPARWCSLTPAGCGLLLQVELERSGDLGLMLDDAGGFDMLDEDRLLMGPGSGGPGPAGLRAKR